MSEIQDILLNLNSLVERINAMPAKTASNVRLTKRGVPDKRGKTELTEDRRTKLRENAKSARDAAKAIWVKQTRVVAEDDVESEPEYEFSAENNHWIRPQTAPPAAPAKSEPRPEPETSRPKAEKRPRKKYVKRMVAVDVTDDGDTDAYADAAPPKVRPPAKVVEPVEPIAPPPKTKGQIQAAVIKNRLLGRYLD